MDEEPSYRLSVTHDAGPERSDAGPERSEGPVIDAAALCRAVESTLVRHGCPRASINIAIVDDGQIAELNRSFLGREGPTDVVAFDLRDRVEGSPAPSGGEGRMGTGGKCRQDTPAPWVPLAACPPVLADRARAGELPVAPCQDPDGELVLSIDTAAREARRRDHSTQAELMLYAVHGTLHLLGYEDSQPESAEQMHRTEDAILSELGVGPVYSAEAG